MTGMVFCIQQGIIHGIRETTCYRYIKDEWHGIKTSIVLTYAYWYNTILTILIVLQPDYFGKDF